MKILAVYGVGGLGREVLELAGIINQKNKMWDSFIFIDDSDVPAVVSDCNVYKYDIAREKFGTQLEIAMGIGEPATREKLFAKINNDNFNTPTLIHPNVYIPESTDVGQGVVIQDGCFVSCDVTIKNYAYLQPRCAIGHDCVLNEGCIISTFSTLAGAVHIGRYSYVGMSASIRELVKVGNYAIVGMASAVYKDVPDEMIAMGNPARPMKKNEDHRVFNRH